MKRRFNSYFDSRQRRQQTGISFSPLKNSQILPVFENYLRSVAAAKRNFSFAYFMSQIWYSFEHTPIILKYMIRSRRNIYGVLQCWVSTLNCLVANYIQNSLNEGTLHQSSFMST